MLTIQELLRIKSDMLDHAKVKLVRHKDWRPEYRDLIKNKEELLKYQKGQVRPVFNNCDYIVSFVGEEHGKSVFLGVFKVGSMTPKNEKYWYELKPVSTFDDFVNRVIIDWGKGARKWDQWYDKQPKEIVEILPAGYIGSFPGLLEFVLNYDDLKQLTMNPDANRDWKDHLSAVNGIYMILDNKTGQQYIGSANGKEGIWQRWSTYAKDPTGGNKELKTLLANDPTYHSNFKYSVLQTLPSNITQREIVATENLYKEKLGSRAHGLNSN